jgi:tRNA pseudouridine55 synthase
MSARASRRALDGWLVLDKDVGQTSTGAVGALKRLFAAKKVGHAGTLDPLASGVLPIAFGEATKTVSFVMDGQKSYRFTARWGIETDSDDSDGAPMAESAARPAAEAIRALLPRFLGVIEQTPPRYSALKIDGERAYDLARDGEVVELEARPVEIHRLSLIDIPDPDHAVLSAECGKGTYVRALARDMGRVLGCFGHVSALRRTGVGSFREQDGVSLEQLEAADAAALAGLLQPVSAGVQGLPTISVSRADAARLARGQAVLLRGRDAPIVEGSVAIFTQGDLIALAEAAEGELRPRRIFNLNAQAR